MVTLTAAGLLPCGNYIAQLEQRSERVFPPTWNMVFYVQPVCLRVVKPFESVVYMPAGNARTVRVLDADRWHDVLIVDPFVPAPFADAMKHEEFVVYAQLPKVEPPGNCFIAPAGSLVPAIYYAAFGPASRAECEHWKDRHCRMVERGGDVPWPGLEE